MRTGKAPFVPSQNIRDTTSFLDCFPMEYPGNGVGDYRESAIEVRTKAGHVAVTLNYDSYTITDEKPVLEGMPSTFGEKGECQTLILHCSDHHLNLKADLIYTLFEQEDVLVRSVNIINEGTEPIDLTKVFSACLDIDDEEQNALWSKR